MGQIPRSIERISSFREIQRKTHHGLIQNVLTPRLFQQVYISGACKLSSEKKFRNIHRNCPALSLTAQTTEWCRSAPDLTVS